MDDRPHGTTPPSTLPFDTIGDGPPVVLVNGAAPLAWGALPERLAPTRRVVTYARRGFPPNDDLGRTASLREHADDLAAILEKVGRGTVVAWSSGGIVGLDVALHRPELVDHLVVLEAPLHAKRTPTPGLVWAVAGSQIKGRFNAEAGARHFLVWGMGRSDGRPSDVARFDDDALRRAAPAIVNELGQGTGENEVPAAELPNLEVDTTWLVGTASQPPIQKIGRSVAAASPRITLREVEGVGHAIAIEAPNVIAEVVNADSAA